MTGEIGEAPGAAQSSEAKGERPTGAEPSTSRPSVIASHPKSAFYGNGAKWLFCIALPLAIAFMPLPVEPKAKTALAISAFMIAAWIVHAMEYAAVGLVGLTLYWLSGVAKPNVIFSGFANEASWFYFGAMLLGAIATKSGLPQRLADLVISKVGLTYSRLLLGLIIMSLLLTFLIPSGAAALVILASISIGLMNAFGVQKGSNIGRGVFIIITYTAGIFNKMILAGTASIVARALIYQHGGINISWGVWFIAFLPCVIGTILASWWLTLKLFPPESDILDGMQERLTAHFHTKTPWTAIAIKAAILSGLACTLWMTDWLHHIPAAAVAMMVGLVALLPVLRMLDESDFKKISLLPFFFVGAALGMVEVLKVTGGLSLLNGVLISAVSPLLNSEINSIITLYWGGFLYHLATASEVSMLVTSTPALMEFAKTNHINPAWVGLIWSFASGGKLFAYESAVLVLGYSYGYFRHVDLLKIGAILTIVEFVLLFFCVMFYWPLIGLGYQ